ncbi:MAG: ligase-associated DNA damage response endonuclease PdeM [Xanthobacteraceae bacterium]
MRSAHLAAQRDEEHTFALAGAEIVADPSGALYWPDERMLVVADLHLEKGSAFAKRGVLLPPYDTASTLARLAGVLLRYAPRSVVALGDSFHDGDGPRRMSSVDETTLRTLRGGRDWIWIAGNHDAELPRDLGGSFAASLAVGPLIFRHLPLAGVADGEVAGHLHPVARLSQRGRSVSRRSFTSDGRRLVMPAFGAYAGGLNIRDGAFFGLFGTLAYSALMLGEQRVYALSAARCFPD